MALSQPSLFNLGSGEHWFYSVFYDLLENIYYPRPQSITAQMKISCDNTVVRMVSSGKQINRVTFEYRQLEPSELETSDGNSIPEFCLSRL